MKYFHNLWKIIEKRKMQGSRDKPNDRFNALISTHVVDGMMMAIYEGWWCFFTWSQIDQRDDWLDGERCVEDICIYIYIFVFIFIYIYTLPACMQHASGYKGSHRFTRMRFLFFFSLLNQSCQRIDRRTSRVTRDRWTTGHVKRWSDTDKHEQMRSAL